MKQEDWETAAKLLAGIDRDTLRKKHQDVEELYVKACKNAGIDPYPVTPEPEPEADPTPTPIITATPDPDATPKPFLVTEDDEPGAKRDGGSRSWTACGC